MTTLFTEKQIEMIKKFSIDCVINGISPSVTAIDLANANYLAEKFSLTAADMVDSDGYPADLNDLGDERADKIYSSMDGAWQAFGRATEVFDIVKRIEQI